MWLGWGEKGRKSEICSLCWEETENVPSSPCKSPVALVLHLQRLPAHTGQEHTGSHRLRGVAAESPVWEGVRGSAGLCLAEGPCHRPLLGAALGATALAANFLPVELLSLPCPPPRHAHMVIPVTPAGSSLPPRPRSPAGLMGGGSPPFCSRRPPSPVCLGAGSVSHPSLCPQSQALCLAP